MNILDQRDIEMQVDATLAGWDEEFEREYNKPDMQTLEALGNHLAQLRARTQNKAGKNDRLPAQRRADNAGL